MPYENKSSKTQAVLQERRENTARITSELETQGYHAEDATVSIVKANVMACVTALPLAAAFCVAFFLLNRDISPFRSFVDNYLLIMAAMLVSVPVHEFLHGCGWVLSCRKKWKSIQFGVMWDSLTPYCHCREAMGVMPYYVGLLMPLTVLGILPCILALVLKQPLLLWAGAYNVFVAGGDTTIAWIILKYLGRDAKILDHPDQCGAVGFVR